MDSQLVKQLFGFEVISGVVANRVENTSSWTITIFTTSGEKRLLTKVKSKEIRIFKTLQGVQSELESLGIKAFQVEAV